MALGIFQGDDIDIFLTEEEIINLSLLEIKDNTIIHPRLAVLLTTHEGSSLQAIVQKQQFEHLGDGIEVERKDYGFFIRINDNAYWRIRNTTCYGTRYDGENKIHFRRV